MTNPCVPNPCPNGNCTVIPKCSDQKCVLIPKCECSPGFSGLSCAESSCDPNPCKNGGKCAVIHELPFVRMCECIAGFYGALCEKMARCVPNPCRNGGMCSEFGASHRCACKTGFIGLNCESISKIAKVYLDFESNKLNLPLIDTGK